MEQGLNAYANRDGVLPISWNRFFGICKGLARAVARFRPELILAIGRGGFCPGTLLAHMLRVEIWPVRVSRRVNDVVVYREPRWIIRPTEAAAEKRVLVVDEIVASGATVGMVMDEVKRLGGAEVRSAVLYAHDPAGWSTAPDYVGIISDALILNPWDREILQDGRFQPHPEYLRAFAEQGIGDGEPTDPSWLIGVEAMVPERTAFDKGDDDDG